MDNKIFLKYRSLLEKYIKPEGIKWIYFGWNTPNRKYHTVKHLEDVIDFIEENKIKISSLVEYETLLLAAFFHDVIYDAKKNDNEDLSISFFEHYYNHEDKNVKRNVISLIETTKHRKIPRNPLEKLFWQADNEILTRKFYALKEYEKKIRTEFLFVPKKIYKEKRIEFLKSNLGLFSTKVDDNLYRLIDWVENKYK